MSVSVRRGPADYVTLAESIAFAVAIELGLRIMPFARLLDLLERLEPGRVWAAPCPSDRLARFSAAACRLLPVESTCLRESLVLVALLRRRGASPTLRVGVSKQGVGLAAHAWVECAGVTPHTDRSTFHELVTPKLQARISSISNDRRLEKRRCLSV